MKKHKTIISLMSGTSIDSIDACLVKIFEDFSFEVIDSYSLEYTNEIKNRILNLANNNADVKEICRMNFLIGELFAEAANLLIKKTNYKKEEIDFISTHGQTICHIPEEEKIGNITTRSTLQIGDISVISERTGIMTIGDFRTKDIAAGGQGAPLVPFADKILFGLDKNRLIQNIGDKNGETAKKGKIDKIWLDELVKEPYYKQIPPKSTGRELFNKEYAENIYKTAPKNSYDVIATITKLTAKVIANSYKDFIFSKTKIDEVVLGGGGAYNKTLISYLKEELPNIEIKTHQDFNIPDKLKECIAFAYLGYCTITKQPNNVPSCTGANYPVVMGKISY